MINKKNIAPVIIAVALAIGCNHTEQNQHSNDTALKDSSIENSTNDIKNVASLPTELLGEYEGEQPSYILKNQSGEEMIISGKKVKTPKSKYKISLGPNNTATMEQINLEDNSTYNYEGNYKISGERDGVFEMICEFSDKKSSNPSYKLLLLSNSLTIRGSGNNEPEFILKSSKAVSADSKQIAFEGVLGEEYLGQGEWSIELEVTQGPLKGKNITVWKQTCGLGMEDTHSIEMTGDLELDGSDYNRGQKVKGTLVETKGKFANLGGGGSKTKNVWRFKELYTN